MSWSIVLTALLLAAGASCSSHEDAIREEILRDYNHHSLPNIKTNVSIRVTVVHLDLDEDNQILMLDSWLSMEWTDPRLTWNSDVVDMLAFSRDQVWTPDITLYNNGQADVADHLKSILVRAQSNGEMIFVPTSKLPAACVLDMTYWPHDVHKCQVKFGSWVHSAQAIDLLNKDDSAEVEFEITTKDTNGMVMMRGQWKVLDSIVVRNEKKYSCCPEVYVDLTVEITVQRDAPAFMWLVKLPFAVFCLMTGLLFLMPPGSSLKLVFGALVMLLHLQFLAFTKTVVLFSPSHTPVIIQMVGGQLVLCLLSVVASVMVVRMVSSPHTDGLPDPFKRLSSVLGGALLLGNYRKLVTGCTSGSYPKSIKGEELEMVSGGAGVDGGHSGGQSMTAEAAEWLLMGAIVDRLLLLLYGVSIVYNFAVNTAVL